MTIGEIITSENKTVYKITKDIATGDRPNANVYLCEDSTGKKFIAKHFYKQRPMPFLAYAKKNHYGRRRDGSKAVFNEIKDAGKKNEFVVRHVDRIKHKGKWVIIIDFIDGTTLTDFIWKNRSDKSLLSNAIKALANTLSIWHSNEFAHGDPHLDNCLIVRDNNNELKVFLIDYSQIHHPTFQYCKRFNCYTPNSEKRMNEDLINPATNFGRGFKTELSALSEKLDYGTHLKDVFEENYKRQIATTILNK